MKRTLLTTALFFSLIGLSFSYLKAVIPTQAQTSTSAPIFPSIYAQDTRVNSTVAEPRRIRLPKFATQRSTKENPNCICPYDRAYSGNICQGTSAYAKPGGDEPHCYQGESTARQLWWFSPETRFVDRDRMGK
ncbi:hypothetical protein F7734_07515 [Scytonema sp. UIC 10036]|uniref:hypothetical protein n=1 Tax=Scytonema sp. UIC 10036 TaxID=2304196 RepID=UPI0012DAB198|nr:hypothetical protein [Scytonema sp. UIC 10036]MUG92312.1 hypothetical protein [Scytonema sp. UIC 10036]